MLWRLALILEIVAVVVCINCIYGKKFKFDFATSVFCLSTMIILQFINELKLSNVSTFLVYVLLYIYCVWKFKQPMATVIINELFFLVFFAALQFICMLIVGFFIENNEMLRNVVGNFIVLLICVCILPKIHIDKMAKSLHNKKVIIVLPMCFVVAVTLLLLMQNKIDKEIKIPFFIFSIPAIILLVFLISKWSVLDKTVEQMEQEVQATKTLHEKYEDLLINVRMRQHEFKNHIAAILSTHYAYHTYEQLVNAQKEYYGKVELENRYNGLLAVGDGFVCGFLFGMFEDIEKRGVTVRYKICAHVEGYKMPVNYLVEMLGILLDNAVEAVEAEGENKTIDFCVEQSENGYQFLVANPYPYVSYHELESWFQEGVSTKGEKRGLGLFHLRQLCNEWDSEIICREKNIEGLNWIEIILKIAKEGHHAK